jgi:diguanylate cyclase (GGDEF)-like protein
MRLFLDRNRTLLPRVDTIYLSARTLVLLGLGWFTFFGELDPTNRTILQGIVALYAVHLLVMVAAVKNMFDLKLAYLSAIVFDMVFVPVFIHYTGGMASSFYLLFYLGISVAAYLLTFWPAVIVTTIFTVIYVAQVHTEIKIGMLFDFCMRLGFLWVCFLALSYVSEYLRKSEKRLLKLFDTLNLRTQELERSQAQLELIYENTRNLASILAPDEVIRETMRIMGPMLQFNDYAVIFRDKWGHFLYRARSVNRKESFQLKAIDDARVELLPKVLSSDEPIAVKELTNRTDYQPVNPKSRSVLIAPLRSHDNSHGLIVAESSNPDHFQEKDIKIFTMLARSAALALENAELHRQTEQLTIVDDLTGAYNYRYFVRKLEEEKKRAIRYDLPLSLIMVDIDWFKKVNDSYGHEVGNIVIKDLARVIQHCIRDVDIFVRYGGEEFVIILPQTPLIESSAIGERIRAQVEEMVVDTGRSGKLKITVSVGVTSFPENGKAHEELVSVVDQALYRAKGSGKNLVCNV